MRGPEYQAVEMLHVCDPARPRAETMPSLDVCADVTMSDGTPRSCS